MKYVVIFLNYNKWNDNVDASWNAFKFLEKLLVNAHPEQLVANFPEKKLGQTESRTYTRVRGFVKKVLKNSAFINRSDTDLHR